MSYHVVNSDEMFEDRNAGLDGAWRVTVSSLPSIVTTDDIIGRAAGFPCTHRRPTWKHFSTSPS
jgi:hypothetical protein